MNKKILLFMNHFSMGGVEQVMVTAVNAWVAAGNEVAVVWLGNVEENHLLCQIDSRVKQIRGCEIWPLLQRGPRPKKGVFKKILWQIHTKFSLFFLRFIHRHIPDFEQYHLLVDFHNGSSDTYRVKKKACQKIAVWLHGCFKSFHARKTFKRHRLFSYDRIICLTDDFRRNFAKTYPGQISKVTRIYNPFDFTFIRESSIKSNPLRFNMWLTFTSPVDFPQATLTGGNGAGTTGGACV